MFLCPICKNGMELSVCGSCGYQIPVQNNIWQFTDMPDIVIAGEGDKYIGYEHIGEHYSGERRYLMEERNVLFAEEVSAINGEGVFLDLGCGDGCFTVPCAQNGSRIIAGDISNAMLSILQEKAAYNHVSLENVVLCRMNALEIPVEDESIDTVVANSMLHLVSNPGKVVDEIYRVLKKGGSFVCLDDQPGKKQTDSYRNPTAACNQPADSCDNQKYNEIVNNFYGSYWNKLKRWGIMPIKYSWRFDRAGICDGLFREKREKLIERGNPYRIRLQDGFLSRFTGRGFSDQTDVPKDIHEKVMEELMEEFRQKYGEDFGETAFGGIEEDMLVTVYRK